jgi:glycosyltransferase involved in cell wall biosynthesis
MNGLHLVKWPGLVDRRAGFPSRSFISSTQPAAYALFLPEDFDVVCDQQPWPRDEWHWRGLRDLLLRGEIRVAFFESLFFPPSAVRANRLAMRLIRAVGIRTVMAPHGMDVFYRDQRVTRFDWVGRAQRDYPGWNLTEHRQLARERTALWCEHADFVLSADSTVARFLPRRDLNFKWFPVDCDTLKPVAPAARATPVVLHAPQHRSIKGTDELQSALSTLEAAGIRSELRLIENVAREQALQMYAEADVIADQFCMGAFGMFALEGLALGKPVLTYLDQEQLGDPAFNLPIVNTNPDNIERVLAVLLQLPELRERIGRASREAVERYQSVEALGEVWTRIYRHVWHGTPLQAETLRHFSTRSARSFSEDPLEEEFWPVPVADLMPAIRACLACLAPAARPSVEAS